MRIRKGFVMGGKRERRRDVNRSSGATRGIGRICARPTCRYMGDVPADPVRCLRVGGYLLSGLSVYQRSHSMGSPNSKKRSPVSVVRMERTGRIRMPDELRKLSDGSTICMLGEPDGTDSIAELGEPGECTLRLCNALNLRIGT